MARRVVFKGNLKSDVVAAVDRSRGCAMEAVTPHCHASSACLYILSSLRLFCNIKMGWKWTRE